MRHFLNILLSGAAAVLAAVSCKQDNRDTEPLIDPWLRERTPVNVRLESQIGAALISNDWRDDSVGSVSVSLITSALDLTRVRVEAIDFKYPDSEFCPTASISPGSTIDLSSGSAHFIVTAYNGEIRDYTITYSGFSDPTEGTFTFTKIAGLIDSTAPKCAMIIIGGWDGEVVRSTVMDKYWHWGAGYMPTDEDDNTLSFLLEKADAETGATFGSIVNTAGPDGKYANYVYNNSIDVNDRYRIFPAGKGRWANLGNGVITVYDYDDPEYTSPLYTVSFIEAGTYDYDGKSISIPYGAFVRSFEGPFNTIDWNYPDTRWYTDNLRHVFWLVKKDSDSALPNHNELLAQ